MKRVLITLVAMFFASAAMADTYGFRGGPGGFHGGVGGFHGGVGGFHGGVGGWHGGPGWHGGGWGPGWRGGWNRGPGWVAPLVGAGALLGGAAMLGSQTNGCWVWNPVIQQWEWGC